MNAAETAAPQPRRAAPSSGKFQPRVGKRGIDPLDELVAAISAYADALDASGKRSDALGSHWVANTERRHAADLRHIVKEHRS